MDLVVELMRHNTMMNERLLAACRGLDDDQLAVAVEGTYGGIGATLVHVANSQIGYVPRYVAPERPDSLPHDPLPGLDAIGERLTLGNRLLEEAAAQADDGREVRVSGDDPPATWAMPGALLLLQAVNHATEHRAQIATILTQLGVEPPDMSGWAFFDAAGHLTSVDEGD